MQTDLNLAHNNLSAPPFLMCRRRRDQRSTSPRHLTAALCSLIFGDGMICAYDGHNAHFEDRCLFATNSIHIGINFSVSTKQLNCDSVTLSLSLEDCLSQLLFERRLSCIRPQWICLVCLYFTSLEDTKLCFLKKSRLF